MSDNPGGDSSETIRALEERVAKLERQMAVLMKDRKPAASQFRTRDLRDRYDSLDYPER